MVYGKWCLAYIMLNITKLSLSQTGYITILFNLQEITYSLI